MVLPDGTLGIYARPRFDEESNETGTEAVVIVELKKPGVPLGADEKNQAWKYIKELMDKGHVDELTNIRAFVMGDRIERGEHRPRKEGDDARITPMLYSTFISQAEKRMLNLHRRLSDAPFMQEILNQEASTADSAAQTALPIEAAE